MALGAVALTFILMPRSEEVVREEVKLDKVYEAPQEKLEEKSQEKPVARKVQPAREQVQKKKIEPPKEQKAMPVQIPTEQIPNIPINLETVVLLRCSFVKTATGERIKTFG